jgi:ParB family transcriptional regulator, chromosome partitioning protein
MALGKSLNNILEDYFGDEVSTIVNQNTQVKDKSVKKLEDTLQVVEKQELKPNLQNIAIDQIIVGPYQTRTTFDTQALESLAESIKENGLIQPILVHLNKEGQYILLAGERRYRACIINGFDKIEAKIIDDTGLSEDKKVFLTAYENLLREDLDPVELANTYQMLLVKNNLELDQLAKNLGKSQQYLKNHLNLLNLDKRVQDLLRTKKLTEGQARHLKNLEADQQFEMAKRIIEDGLSVRALESLKTNDKNEKKDQQNEESSLVSFYSSYKEVGQDPMLEHPMFQSLKELSDKLPNSQIKFSGSLKNGKLTLAWKK